MSASGKDDDWGSAPPRKRDEESRHSGIVFIQNSGEPRPDADSREVFVRFACGEVLRDFQLSPEALELGIIPDSKQKPFAAAYLFVGSELVRSEADAGRLRDTAIEQGLKLILVQATRDSKFSVDHLWAIRKSAQGWFLFKSAPKSDTATLGEVGVLNDTFRWFRGLSEARGDRAPHVSVRYVYVSRGELSDIGPDLRNEVDGIVAMTRRSLNPPHDVKFDFIAGRDLIA